MLGMKSRNSKGTSGSDGKGTKAGGGSAPARKRVDTGQPNLYTYEVIRELPHDRTAYTQGLQYEKICDRDDGSESSCREIMWESTGLHGRSEIREVDLETGNILRSRSLPQSDFGEGVTRHGDRLFQLTWLSGKSWSYAVDDFNDRKQLETPLKDGWGITSNGTHLWAGDSSDQLYVLDPNNLHILQQVGVNDAMGSIPVRWVNELEWVDGLIYANIYTTDCIAQINPETGGVVGWVLLKGLKEKTLAALPDDAPKTGPQAPEVLNGIAFDGEKGRLFVTGKLWPKIYQIELRPMYQHHRREEVEQMNEEIRRQCIINAKRNIGKM